MPMLRMPFITHDKSIDGNFGAVQRWAKALLLPPIKDFASAAPTEGTFSFGDIVWNNEPAAGEYIGWVCVEAGTPGTWKGFGTIQA